MSRQVHERLRDLETDVRDMKVLPAAAIRARGRSRGRRQLATWMVAGAVVATTVGVTVEWPQQRTVTTADRPVISCFLTLPDSPAAVQIRVLDGGASAGLPDTTAAQLRARTFTVLDEATAGAQLTGSAELRYGPTAIGAAALLRAALHGEVTMRFDPDRHDETIDLTLGPAFTRLATATEINQNLVAAGEPSAPPQCA